jgi:hypothetical protein
MARQSGGGAGALLFGIVVGAAGMYYGPGLYQKYVARAPEAVRIEVAGGVAPGIWNRVARFDIEYSAKRPDGKDWDWPMTAPELQLCVREGSEYRRCLGPRDSELAACQGKFRCTTGPIKVPDGGFTVELNEWDDYNQPDPIGAVECNIGARCQFPLGVVTAHP